MTSSEFVQWLKGFTEGVHEYAITPKQWDLLKERLAEVEDKVLILESPKFPFGVPNTTPNTQPFPNWQEPHYPNPLDNPYKITCTPGTTSTPGMVVTTTPGVSSITVANPPFGFGSTSTAYGYPSGSAWSYTTSKEKTLLND
jgi:hypothetical protein